MFTKETAPWRFRWVLNFLTYSKRGMWNSQNVVFNSEILISLKSASIEAQDRNKNGHKVVAECSKDNFCSFQWIAQSQFNFNSCGELPAKIMGLKMLTIKEEISFYEDGTCRIEPRKHENNFYEFGEYLNV